MPKGNNQKLTNIDLVRFATTLADHRVRTWPHASCEPCTPQLLAFFTELYPTYYDQTIYNTCLDDTKQHRICTDSAGIIRGFFWSNAGEGLDEYWQGDNRYRVIRQRYAFPDIDAPGIKALFLELFPKGHGAVETTMPDVPGVVLFRKKTLGIYVGDGTVISAARYPGFVERSPLAAYNWETWSYVPFRYIQYIDNPYAQVQDPLILQLHDTNHNIKTIKSQLYSAGFYGGRHPSGNNYFDNELQDAVLAFQERMDIIPTGIITTALQSQIREVALQKLR